MVVVVEDDVEGGGNAPCVAGEKKTTRASSHEHVSGPLR
jgi:hypothetical protein